MYIETVISELLYIGIIAEKGRCYRKIWRIGYKSILKKHIRALYMLQKYLTVTNEKEVQTVIDTFVKICSNNYEIGKFYPFQDYRQY